MRVGFLLFLFQVHSLFLAVESVAHQSVNDVCDGVIASDMLRWMHVSSEGTQIRQLISLAMRTGLAERGHTCLLTTSAFVGMLLFSLGFPSK